MPHVQPLRLCLLGLAERLHARGQLVLADGAAAPETWPECARLLEPRHGPRADRGRRGEPPRAPDRADPGRARGGDAGDGAGPGSVPRRRRRPRGDARLPARAPEALVGLRAARPAAARARRGEGAPLDRRRPGPDPGRGALRGDGPRAGRRQPARDRRDGPPGRRARGRWTSRRSGPSSTGRGSATSTSRRSCSWSPPAWSRRASSRSGSTTGTSTSWPGRWARSSSWCACCSRAGAADERRAPPRSTCRSRAARREATRTSARSRPSSASGLRVGEVSGSSIGALVAALVAVGYSAGGDRPASGRPSGGATSSGTPGRSGACSREVHPARRPPTAARPVDASRPTSARWTGSSAGARFRDLRVPCTIQATDLTHGRPVWFRRDSHPEWQVALAVAAAAALPGLMTPGRVGRPALRGRRGVRAARRAPDPRRSDRRVRRVEPRGRAGGRSLAWPGCRAPTSGRASGRPCPRATVRGRPGHGAPLPRRSSPASARSAGARPAVVRQVIAEATASALRTSNRSATRRSPHA